MAKHLFEILGEDIYEALRENYTPFPEDERRFYQKHGLELGKEGEPPIKFPRFDNMYSEPGKFNADTLFKGASKQYDREANRQGYNPGKDEEHYEEYVDEGRIGNIGRNYSDEMKVRRKHRAQTMDRVATSAERDADSFSKKPGYERETANAKSFARRMRYSLRRRQKDK